MIFQEDEQTADEARESGKGQGWHATTPSTKNISLAAEFQQDIEGNKTVLLLVSQFLETQQSGVVSEDTLSQIVDIITQETNVASLVSAVGGSQSDSDQLQATLRSTLRMYVGQPMHSQKSRSSIIQSLSDILSANHTLQQRPPPSKWCQKTLM